VGFIRHHAFVVTGGNWSPKTIEDAHRLALAIFDYNQVSELSGFTINGYRSFFIAPDGSKEGWEESAAGDIKRMEFKRRLRNEFRYEDKSSMVDWVEVFYGSDDGISEIVDHSKIGDD